MKKLVWMVLLLALVLALSACGCKHETWIAADCETPKTCADCGQTEGEALGHNWVDATCETPKTCQSCEKTEGDALDHSWTEADCENPKTCATCEKTEGEALGHAWVDATTETPKTCQVCEKTEGDRIITDERFTTAANEQLFGLWRAEFTEYVPEFDMDMTMYVSMEFHNDGTMKMGMELKDPDAFMALMIQVSVEQTYAEMASMGYDKAAADQAFLATYGMTVEAYMKEVMSSMDLNELLGVMDAMSMVYYAEGDQLYTGISWNTEMTGQEFTLEEGVLYLHEEGAEEPVAYERVYQE